MDYVCSLTGKSPSTTGAGSEGALTKGPFNALMPSIDLNSMVVSMILTELAGFSTPAGHIGPKFDVGHDISLLIPEVWCRMGPEERDPKALIEAKMLEKIEDFEADGVAIPASRLGYRITHKFVRTYLGRIFDNPSKVFPDQLLKPELQDADSFADGILHIAEAQKRVALQYMSDGGYELACPPLQAVLSIMAYGEYEGKSITDPEVRNLFNRDTVLESDWYKRRLATKQNRDLNHWKAFQTRLTTVIQELSEGEMSPAEKAETREMNERLEFVRDQIAEVSSPDYQRSLIGTLGADPMQPSLSDKSMINKLAGV